MIQATNSHDHAQRTPFGEQPRFETAEHWLEHYHDATKHGQHPWPPTTRDELLLAEELGLLEFHPEWIPNRIGLRLLGLPDFFGRQLEPFPERFRERFLATLNADDEFAAAVLNLIQRGRES